MALINELGREEVLFSLPGTESASPPLWGEEEAAGKTGGETQRNQLVMLNFALLKIKSGDTLQGQLKTPPKENNP